MLYKTAPLEPDCYYHIYNRANGQERIFLSDENYRFFLLKYSEYVAPFTDLFCYCLMPNHFHFLIRVKGELELESLFRAFPKFKTLEKLPSMELLLSKQFSNFFSSYTQAFNKVEGRRGSLFMKNFKRIKIEDEKYLIKLIHYIHHNPIEAGLVNGLSEWKFSSYSAIVSSKPTAIRRNEIISLFSDLQNFLYCHRQSPKISGVEF